MYLLLYLFLYTVYFGVVTSAWHHLPEQWGRSDETSRIFSGHVNSPKMNGGKCIWGTKSNNHRGGVVVTNNTLQK